MTPPRKASMLLFVALTFGAADVAAQQKADIPEKTRTLTELLALAYENAAVLDEHAASVEIAEWQQYRANHAWTPKFKSDTLIAPVPANADPWQFGANLDEIGALNLGPFITEKLSVFVPVYTFGRIDTAQALAELGIDKAKLERDQARRDLEYQVKRAYYSIQLSRAFDELLGEGQKLIKEKLAEMEEAREFGDADFDTQDLRRLQVFEAEIDSRAADNAMLGRIAREGIRYFTGLEPRAPLNVQPLPASGDPAPLGPVELYLDTAEQSRAEVALLQHAVRARELQLKLERANFFPNIVVAAELGVGWSTEDIALRPVCRIPSAGAECIDTADLRARPYENPLDFFSLGIGLGMRWELDFFQQYGKYREVLAQNDQVLAQRRRALGAIELEVRKLWLDAAQALEKIEITARRLDAARRWRNQFGLTLQTGGGNLDDATEPLKAYYEALALHLQARYDYLVARAALAKGIGVPTLPEVNDSPPESSDD